MGSDKNEKLSNPTWGSPVHDPDAIPLGAFSADVNLAYSPTYVRPYSGYARSDAQRPLFSNRNILLDPSVTALQYYARPTVTFFFFSFAPTQNVEDFKKKSRLMGVSSFGKRQAFDS